MAFDLKKYRVIWLLMSIAFFISAIWYGLTSLDIVPDSIGPGGYIDDVIIIVSFLAIAFALYQRAKLRSGQIKKKYGKIGIFDLIFNRHFWFVLFVIGIAGGLLYFSITLFPEAGALTGNLEKILIAAGALVALIKHNYEAK
jgi:hypothetical protein